jgi:type II secretory pathway component PulF
MSSIPQSSSGAFAYTAQTYEGDPTSGTIDATDFDDASKRLNAMRLRIIRLDPAQRPVRAKPLGGEDFAAFNQQLAHLAAAGLPIEQGLRLIAEDLRHGGLAQSVRDLSAELERGVPLAEAFKLHEKQFPPLYGAIVDAGVRAGNLPAVLLNLGRHIELVSRLRSALWNAAAYPLTVLGGLLVIMIFLSTFVLPKFVEIYREWMIPLPLVTRMVLAVANWTPLFITVALLVFVGFPILRIMLRAANLNGAVNDLLIHVPMIGPLLRRNLIARWCDASKLAIQAGMDLPAAIELAGNVVGSPTLHRDGARVIELLNHGQPIDAVPARQLSILPLPVLAVAQLAASRSDLPESLETLARLYEQQAEMRLGMIQSVLTPLLIVMVGAIIGVVVLGLFAPMVGLFQAFT